MKSTKAFMDPSEFIYRHHIPLPDSEFAVLSKYIYDKYGINFSPVKKQLLESRLQKRLAQLGIKNFKEYLDHVLHDEENEEIVKMVNSVTTNKTDFFREKKHFDFLSSTVLPALTLNTTKLKIWSAACSSGEEVYTIAMTIEDYLEKRKSESDFHILGTDISTEVLTKAYRAIYPEEIAEDIPEDLKKKFVLKSIGPGKKTIRINKQLRDKVLFERFNLMSTKYPKAGSYDIIFCRNAIIYFDKATQQKILTNLCQCLKVGGYLFLGHSESIIGINLPLKQTIHTCYQKIVK